MSNSTASQNEEHKFQYTAKKPFSTFIEGKPAKIPFVVSGLLTEGGLSIIGAKSKQGKSSLSRYEAVCITQGKPFLGRDTVQGEAVILNLEDPLFHVDNCLKAIGYDPGSDAAIHILDELAPTPDQSIEALGGFLTNHPNVRLVVVDTLAKLLQIPDLNDYMLVLNALERLRNMAKTFPHLHVQGLVHNKKIKTDDPFDSFLGSSALRAQPDTNIAIFDEGGQHIIQSETRIGKHIPATLLKAELTEIDDSEIVTSFSLDMPLASWTQQKTDRSGRKQDVSFETRIIKFLKGQPDMTATLQQTLAAVEGRYESKSDAIDCLVGAKVIIRTGKSRSPTNPLTLRLNPGESEMWNFIKQNNGDVAEEGGMLQ